MTLSVTDLVDTDVQEKEEEWLALLHQLAEGMKRYESLSRKRDAAEKERTSLEVLSLMRKLAMIHPEEETRKKYDKDANAWEKGDRFDKHRIIRPHMFLLQGCAILIATPILASGAVLYGSGKVLTSIGDMLTFGRLDKVVTGSME